MTLTAIFAAMAWAQQPCTFTLNPTTRAVPATPDTVGQFTVTASAGTCGRTAVSSHPDWLTISFGATGTGNGSIGYRIEANDTPSERTGTISVGAARFTVTQAARDCAFDLSTTASRVTYQAGQATLRLTTQCRWTAGSSAGWLKITTAASGSGSATIGYSWDENPSTDPRTAVITAGGRTFTLSQAGAPCVFKVSPGEAAYRAAGGSGALAVSSNCPWLAASAQPWISLAAPASGTRDGTVNYKVAPNQRALARVGAITVSGETVAIRQAANDGPGIFSVANAASLVRDLAAPGTMVTLTGERLGGKVLIDGKPALVVSSSEEAMTAIVPYGVAGKTSVAVVVELDDKQSPEYTLPVAAVAPGIFTRSAAGDGPAMAKNEDGGENSAAAPAARGSTVTLYATGEGQTDPPGVDGAIPEGDAPKPLAPVEVTIGGAVAQVIRAAGAAGSPAGLLEIQITVPEIEPGDAVAVELRIGGVSAQSGVTLAVR